MTRRGRLLAGLVVLAAAAGGYAWYAGSAQPSPTTPAVAAPLGPIGVGALGRVEPASRIRVLTQPGGMAVTRLDRLLVAEGDPQALAEDYAALRRHLPGLRVLGGCCGTDLRHVAAIGHKCR